VPSGGDGDKIGIWRRDIALAMRVESPGGDGAVFFEAQTVVLSGGDGDKAGVQIGPDDWAAVADWGMRIQTIAEIDQRRTDLAVRELANRIFRPPSTTS